jgi:hypothetical protein
MASRHLLIPRIVAAGTSFSPLPCQAWHGFMVTSAHRVEVAVGADGYASAPPSGAAAARRPRVYLGFPLSGFEASRDALGSMPTISASLSDWRAALGVYHFER